MDAGGQNDELTFSFANGNDWWFHAKGAAGSHVIVKSGGEELPDRTFEEAGRDLAYVGVYHQGVVCIVYYESWLGAVWLFHVLLFYIIDLHLV